MEKANDLPGVLDRVKAVVADSVVIILFIIIATYTFSIFENAPGIAKIIAFIFIFLLYDPIFTSAFGGTIGHMMFGLRVKREKKSNEKHSISICFNSIYSESIIRMDFSSNCYGK